MGDIRRFLPQLVRVALSLAFLFLVAVATAGIFSPLFITILLSAGLAIAAIQALFPVSRLFPIAFANLIAVYAAIFSLFVEEVFGGVDPALLSIGFCLPIVAFVAGCWLRRDQVRATGRAIASIDRLFEASGATALANSAPIQRFWRDAHAGRVHAANDPERAYLIFGNNEFGLPPQDTMV